MTREPPIVVLYHFVCLYSLWQQLFLFGILENVLAFHDCVQSRQSALRNRRRYHQYAVHRQLGLKSLHHDFNSTVSISADTSNCAGGICVGMTNGPHQNGNASYPVAWNGTTGTKLESYMTVPELPRQIDDGMTYYIWTDIFFGDESLGRMNQLVPQLLLGKVLDGSTGPPNYQPIWHEHTTTWMFGAHYFFEILNISTMKIDGHAAYGKIFPAFPGETLYTSFVLSNDYIKSLDYDDTNKDKLSSSPMWTLTMQVVGDPSRISILEVERPYMGIGTSWSQPTTSWLEPNYKHMCINACWELYGAIDSHHLPSSGATYNLTIQQPQCNNHDNNNNHPCNYSFTTWERDEGNGICPSCHVEEFHTNDTQNVYIEINVR